VLLKVYAKVLDGRQEETLRRIQNTLSPVQDDHHESSAVPGRSRRHSPPRTPRRHHR